MDASKFGFVSIQNKKEKDNMIYVHIEKNKINDLQRYIVVRKVIQNIKPCRCNEICEYKKLVLKYNKMYKYNEFIFNEFCR